ncbi:MAG: hypothetical protein EAZ44_05060 [Cytophagia bacterium]|nr:MAG: hypothetical protein EAZ44_05060 [Cytophagia bacterium]
MHYFLLNAQQKDSTKVTKFKKNAFYISFYSQFTLNYERILFVKNKNIIIARLSGAYWENNINYSNFGKNPTNNTYLGVGLIYARSFKNPKHHLNIELFYLHVKGTDPSLQPSIARNYPYLANLYAIKSGWRRQKSDGGWLWRVNASTGKMVEDESLTTTVFYPEVCLGYSF